jgi:hypothetical protein
MHGNKAKPSCALQREGCNNVSSATHLLDVLSSSAHLHIVSVTPPSMTVVHHDPLRFVRHTMRTRRLFLNRLEATPEPQDVVVVIDVLRSFSTSAYAFTAGAAAIHPVETAA